jgi:hypothetical protein
MTRLAGIVQQLKKEHDRAVNEVRRIAAALAAFGAAYGQQTGKRQTSTAARSRMAAAQRARWAKVRKDVAQKQSVVIAPKKRTMSGAARKKIAAAQRARWAKVKDQKKSA